jgi:PAS domain S-box-containing protein
MISHNPLDYDLTPSLLGSLVENAIDGIFLVDGQGKILMANPAFHRLFGYNSAFLINKNINQILPDLQEGPKQNEEKREVVNYSRQITAIREDGVTIPVRIALSEIIYDNDRLLSGIVHDLSEIKNIERELMQLNQQLEQIVVERTTELQDAIDRLLDTNMLLNQSIEKHKAFEAALLSTRDELKKSLEKEKELGNLKSRFISMASHEFKTPLSSILSSAALISRYNKIDQDADRSRHVDRIKASVIHLNTILTDFLSITRLEEGRFEPQVSRFAADTLIADLLSEIEVLLKPQQALSFEYKTDKLEMISDKNLFRNILYNLLSNAIKYSDESTSIECKVKRKGPNLIIEIKDQGIGIPVQDRKHIGFRTYLNFLRGNLTFRSHEDRGTTFIVTIPAIHEE